MPEPPLLSPICGSSLGFSEEIGISQRYHLLISAAILPLHDNPPIQAGRHYQKDPFLITRRPLASPLSKTSTRLPATRA
jgi:hypothetical protein